MKLRRLRDGDVLEDGDVVLVRGGELDLDIMCADATESILHRQPPVLVSRPLMPMSGRAIDWKIDRHLGRFLR